MKSRFNEGGVEVGPVTDRGHYELLELTDLNAAGFASVFPSLVVEPRWSRSGSIGPAHLQHSDHPDPSDLPRASRTLT